jgi:hypothetical protein
MNGHSTAAAPLRVLLRRAPHFTRRALLLVGAAVLLLFAAVILFASGALKRGAETRAAAPAVATAQVQAVAVGRMQVAAGANAGRKRELPDAPRAGASGRVADASLAAALFSPHSWHVEPPPSPPPPPPPAAVPTAPPFPYTFLGALTTSGDKTVYFLSRDDRVIDVHVGDRLDDIYDFESAEAGQLIFNYLPLNIRQPLSSGANP